MSNNAKVSISRITKASPDYPALRELWCQVFGDSPEYVDAFYDNWGDQIWGVVLKEGRAVVSALTCFALGTLRGHQVIVTYAVCTAPPARGKRYGSLITEYARDLVLQSGAISVLSPAEPSLVDFYKPLGYEPNFTSCHFNNPDFAAVDLSSSSDSASSTESDSDLHSSTPSGFYEITASEYWQLREELLSDVPHIVPSTSTCAWVERDYGTFLARRDADGSISEICVPDAELLPVCAHSEDYVQGMSAGLEHHCEKSYLGFTFG